MAEQTAAEKKAATEREATEKAAAANAPAPAPAPAPHPAPAPDTSESDAEAKDATPPREKMEAAAAGGLLPNLSMTAASGPPLNTGGNDVTDKASGYLILNSALSERGIAYTPPAAPPTEESAARQAAPPTLNRDSRVLRELAAAIQTDEDGAIAEPIPGPGQSERGWSPEVTARHPAVEAAMLEEMAAAAGISGEATPRKTGSVQGIDPTDTVALQNAVRENGFKKQRKIMLRNQAHRLAAERLSAAVGTRDLLSPASLAAMSELSAELRDNATANGQ
jgi:hypothetical protein